MLNFLCLKLANSLHVISNKKYKRFFAIAVVKESEFFDSNWYLENNPDVKYNAMDPVEHYVLWGWKEGRNPSSNFNTKQYLEKFPFLLQEEVCPLVHYEVSNHLEKYDLLYSFKYKYLNCFDKYHNKSEDYKIIAKSKYFSVDWYLKNYPDVRNAKIDPVEHYLGFGWKENRNPSSLFDTLEYLDNYSDIKNANLNPLLHYEKFGKYEGRRVFAPFSVLLESEFEKKVKDFKNKNFNKKKVVLFSHELSMTGAPIAIMKIANILNEKGFEVLIVSLLKENSDLIQKYHNFYVIESEYVNRFNLSTLRVFEGFEFAICNTILLANVANKIQNILPTLLYVHEAKEGIFDLVSNEELEVEKIKITKILQKIENIACVSDYAKDFYQPYVTSNIGIIRNYVDDMNIDKGNSTKSDSKRIKIGYVGVVGSEPRKNLELLLRVFSELQKNYNNVELHLIGKDDSLFAQELKRKNLKNVIIHGILSGKKKNLVMNDLNIVVIPSISESCSLVALEAASLSKCIIINENIGAKYMFTNNKDCIICKPNNELSLLNSLKITIEDRNLRDNLSQNARLAYEKFATKKTTEDDLLLNIENMLKKSKSIKSHNSLTIVVPVYNAAEKVRECIKSIIKNTTLSDKVKVLIIDDCSPDKEVDKVLKEFENCDFITIERNEKNLGYTKNINKAIKLCDDSDVILLNSDTIVTLGWIEKIQEKAYLSKSIGTVTPVSNSAGAFSVPKQGTNLIPKHLDVNSMAKEVEQVGKGLYFSVPTGNGFCFYIKRSVFDSIGLFDEINFPIGYGEENDFSMRCKGDGFFNLVALDTYIFHHEHCSFSEKSKDLMERGISKVNSLYPRYVKEINVFSENNLFNFIKNKISENIELK